MKTYPLAIKQILVNCWNNSVDFKNYFASSLLLVKDHLLSSIIQPPIIKSIDDTLTEIIQQRASVCRYGDGEFKLICNQDITFQRAHAVLAKRLKEILLDQHEHLFVCLPDVFRDLSRYTDEPRHYWSLHNSKHRLRWYQLLQNQKVYYNSFISRCYYSYKDKTKCGSWFDQLKQIWKDREVVLIEGRKSRLGVGNDLFENVKSIERILVPEENAFFKYDEILQEAKNCPTSNLILIAAGPTATVLAYDLFIEGYQAIDIGHVDIEYEWFLRKADTKIRIENKYVCEAGAGEGVGNTQDEKYLKEIKAIVVD